MAEESAQILPFMKMHGLGNDFVVVDDRGLSPRITPDIARQIGDRHRGVGFDQLAVISDSKTSDFHLTFFNSDGSISAACGNATRCIARHIIATTGKTRLAITTDRGQLWAEDAGDGLTSVNMGLPQLDWSEIPLSKPTDTLHLPLDGDPVATDGSSDEEYFAFMPRHATATVR